MEGSFKDKLKGNTNAAAGTRSPTAVGCWGHTTRVEASALQQEVAQRWNRRDHLRVSSDEVFSQSSTVVLSIYSKQPLLLLLSDCLFSLCWLVSVFTTIVSTIVLFPNVTLISLQCFWKKKEKPWINQFRTCDLSQFDSWDFAVCQIWEEIHRCNFQDTAASKHSVGVFIRPDQVKDT